MTFASVVTLLLKIAVGTCVGLLCGYLGYTSTCGPAYGTFLFWVQEPSLHRVVITWALAGTLLGAVATLKWR